MRRLMRPGLGTIFVSHYTGPGAQVAGADPGRDCRIVSGPRSRTSPDAWEMRQKVPALQNFQLLPVAP